MKGENNNSKLSATTEASKAFHMLIHIYDIYTMGS